MTRQPLPEFDRLWDYADPAATEARFRQILSQTETSADPTYQAELLTQIARALGLQRRFDEAHAMLDQVRPMLDAIDADAVPRARYLLERGRVFNSAARAADARPLFEQAFELASRHSLDFYAIDAAHMMAIVEPEPERQLDWNLRALRLAEQSADDRARRWRASLYNNIGWTYFDQRRYDEALEIFQTAVTLRRQQDQPRELHVARYCVAKTLRHMNRIDEALAINRELTQQLDSDGYVFEEMGECLLAQGKADEAAPHFRRAHELFSKDQWLVEHEPRRLERLRELGGRS